MSLNENNVTNELCNARLITLERVATSMASRKITKDGLGVTNSTH